MMSEMQADVTATIRALQTTIEAANEALMWAKTVDIDLNRRVTPLPAPALTEQAIVEALKADPAMAGRVIGEIAKTLGDNGRQRLANAACEAVDGADISLSYSRGLQYLAVALAAASYRE